MSAASAATTVSGRPSGRALLHRIPARARVDVAVLGALGVIGVLGFAPAFSDGLYVVAGLGGLLVGIAAAVVAASLAVGPLLSAAIAVAAYFLFGSALAMPRSAILGFVPDAETLSGLTRGAVFGWADVLTLTTPVGAPDYIGVVPYVAGAVVGIVTGTLSTRWYAGGRTPLRSLGGLLAPLAVYAASVLLGTDSPYLAAVRGVAFALIAVVWLGWRTGADSIVVRSSAVLRARLAGIAIVGVVAVVGGALLAGVVAPLGAGRFVLRDHVAPPFDPLAYGSPLSEYRKYVKDPENPVEFTVSGLAKGDRIRVAAMDSYTGQVWDLTGPASSSTPSSIYGLVGDALPTQRGQRTGGTERIRVSIGAWSEPWLPTSGVPTAVSFRTDAPASTDLRYNGESATLIDSGADTERGQSYDLTVSRVVEPKAAALERVPVADVSQPPAENVPDVVASTAKQWSSAASSPIDKLEAIRAKLRSGGLLSHGQSASDTTAPASLAGHGADRMKTLLSSSPMVGDDEQFASAFALMARSLGYPSRVVLGFTASGSGRTVVKAKQISAWAEVAFRGVGWVPFDATPDKDNKPITQPTQPQTQPLPQLRQPERTDPQTTDAISPTKTTSQKKKHRDAGFPAWIAPVAIGVGVPLLVVFGPLLVVGAIKARRRRRRRRHGASDRRAAGAWDETVDHLAELGFAPPRGLTRRSAARALDADIAGAAERRHRNAPPSLGALAVAADTAVWGSADPDQLRLAELWNDADATVAAIGGTVPAWRRLLARYRLAPRGRGPRLADRLRRAADRAAARRERIGAPA